VLSYPGREQLVEYHCPINMNVTLACQLPQGGREGFWALVAWREENVEIVKIDADELARITFLCTSEWDNSTVVYIPQNWRTLVDLEPSWSCGYHLKVIQSDTTELASEYTLA
jgi:hypothetical protein